MYYMGPKGYVLAGIEKLGMYLYVLVLGFSVQHEGGCASSERDN